MGPPMNPTWRTGVIATTAIALLMPLIVAREVPAQPRSAPAALVIESPNDGFSSSTPNPYVRFFARNPTGAPHQLRVVSVALVRPDGGGLLTLPLRDVMIDYARVANPFTVAPNSSPLISAWFNDPTGALARIHDVASFSVTLEIDGVRSERVFEVHHMIREPRRR